MNTVDRGGQNWGVELRRVLLVVPIVVLALGGCADSNPATGPGTVSSVPSEPSLSAQPLSSPRPSGSVPPEVVGSATIQAAVADLAERLGVPPADIEVIEVREVTWSDGGLGCPQPGVGYTQALVNGQLVVLSHNGTAYEYHSGPNRPLFYCADPRPPVEHGGTGAGAL